MTIAVKILSALQVQGQIPNTGLSFRPSLLNFRALGLASCLGHGHIHEPPVLSPLSTLVADIISQAQGCPPHPTPNNSPQQHSQGACYPVKETPGKMSSTSPSEHQGQPPSSRQLLQAQVSVTPGPGLQCRLLSSFIGKLDLSCLWRLLHGCVQEGRTPRRSRVLMETTHWRKGNGGGGEAESSNGVRA